MIGTAAAALLSETPTCLLAFTLRARTTYSYFTGFDSPRATKTPSICPLSV